MSKETTEAEKAFTEGYRQQTIQLELPIGGDKCTSCGEWESRCICEEEDEQ